MTDVYRPIDGYAFKCSECGRGVNSSAHYFPGMCPGPEGRGADHNSPPKPTPESMTYHRTREPETHPGTSENCSICNPQKRGYPMDLKKSHNSPKDIIMDRYARRCQEVSRPYPEAMDFYPPHMYLIYIDGPVSEGMRRGIEPTQYHDYWYPKGCPDRRCPAYKGELK